ncbi:MAG TPA: FliA/WhiG family RNA polymerase sigma factor [Firmicutes bacterium]|jgi:RNA polymerase sigma factor for flagellar operon FliA|nr:FliA/WhiG family RNA polymerase sigma factor [Bacillota bacterium]
MLPNKELWVQLKVGNSEARDEVVESHMYLVYETARAIGKTLPQHIEVEELESFGFLGLLDAVDKFEPERGVPFEAYSRQRIKGAILDGLRKADWLSASARRKAKRIAEVYDQLELELMRPATDEEVAKKLGIDVDSFRKVLQEVERELISLEAPIAIDQEGHSQAIIDIVPSKEDINYSLEKQQAKEILIEAIDKLPEKERLVVALHYYEGLNLTEIGEVLELSTSRISQLHAKAILRLRGRLGRRKEELLY